MKIAATRAAFDPIWYWTSRGALPVEQGWIGKTLQIGRVQLEIIQSTERCIMTGFSQSELMRNKRIPALIARQSQGLFGLYARVLCPGLISLGDSISILSAS